MGAQAFICNALILSLKPGREIIEKMGGIGKFVNYSGKVFTDSGGFQMYSKKIYLGSSEDGVYFKNHFNGDKVFMTPENNMKLQIALGSDVAMCLDTMPLLEHSRFEIEEVVRKTTKWAEICKKTHDKLQKNIPVEKRQLLFGISQGGIYADLRRKSIKELKELNFDGYSIGGLGLGETMKEQHEMIDIVKSVIGEEKPVYLMGVGNPVEIIEGIGKGVDIFDSRFPTRNARNGTMFTSKGRLRLRNSKMKEDKRPLDEECECFVCKKYSRSYIRHLLMLKESNGFRLASYHNIYFITNLIKKVREAIKEGKFDEFLNEFRKNYQEKP